MATRPMLPKQLSSIGQWKLGQPFGEGNHAIIRAGTSKVDGEEVVIKELAKRSPRTNGLLRQEATIMDGLSHRNLVKLHMHMETNDRLFLVMHYAKGGDLLDAVMGSPKHRLSNAVAKRWFAQLLLGIDYLHKNNIVHMDIKPDNVFVDDSCNILIGDYGLSRFYDPHTRSLVARPGTLHYSAPECFSRWLVEQGWGDASLYFEQLGVEMSRKGDVVVYGTELDVWALGVCLYVMLTGKYPFWGTGDTQAEEDYATIETILFQDAPRWPFWIESDCVDMLTRIFDKNPRTRITIGDLMNHRWVREQVQDEIAKIESAAACGFAPRVSSPLASPAVSPAASPHGSPRRSSPLCSPRHSPLCSPKRTGSASPRVSQEPYTAPPPHPHRLQKRFSRSNLLRLHQHQAHTNLLAAVDKSRSAKAPSTSTAAEERRKAFQKKPPPIRQSSFAHLENPRKALTIMHDRYSRFSNLHAALVNANAHKAAAGSELAAAQAQAEAKVGSGADE